MKVSIDWLKELVDLKIPVEDLVNLIPLRVQGGIKEAAENYFELDLKGYNRADLLSMRGVAYEVAALTDSSVLFNDHIFDNNLWMDKGEQIEPKGDLPQLSVEIKDPKLASVYCLAKIEGLKVEQSNKTWVKKLSDSGIRSVNNVADVTNLMMLEYGQPLHAFDAKEVKDETIIVRIAKQDEKLITLDSKIRKLLPGDLLITDQEKALGLAGVMGGKNSEVTEDTTSILLEAAIFDPEALRSTSARLGIQSEASKRFYHGLTKKRLLQALNAAITMYLSMGGKLTALTAIGLTHETPRHIRLFLSKANQLIGVTINRDEVKKYLERLRFSFPGEFHKEDTSWIISPPFWRLDVNIEEDIIEEVARMYGYEKIPAKPLTGELLKKIDQSLFNLISSLRKTLVDLGLIEVQTYSFCSAAVADNLKLDKKTLIRLTNPMSSETEYLRMNIWPNLIEVIAKNYKQGYKDIAVFEIGKIYEVSPAGQPQESYKLAVALLNGSSNPLAELNAIFAQVNQVMALKLTTGPSSFKFPLFHPHRFMAINHGQNRVGGIGEVHKRVTDKFNLPERAAILEIPLLVGLHHYP